MHLAKKLAKEEIEYEYNVKINSDDYKDLTSCYVEGYFKAIEIILKMLENDKNAYIYYLKIKELKEKS